MRVKFYLKIIIALIVTISVGLYVVNWYMENAQRVMKINNRIKLIETFENRSVIHNEIRGSNEDPLIKVSLKLENILKEGVEPRDDKNIFFIESSQVLENPPDTLTPRQLCSYESAALTNPALQIYIVFISLRKSMTLTMTKPLNTLLTYKNVNIVMLKFKQFAKGTPAEDFIANGGLEESHYPVEHTSDVYRLLLLWRYGGFYLDSDMIVKKSVGQLGTNFACAEGEVGIISNAFLSFDRTTGRELVGDFISDQLDNFNETAWSFNGPLSLSKVAAEKCNGLDTNKIKKRKDCDGFHIHPRRLCFPILPTYAERIFMRNFTKALTKRSKKAVTVHLWNRLTKDIPTTKQAKNFYTNLARSFCPRVFRAVDSEF